MNEFGKEIRKRMIDLEMNQGDLAKLLGVSEAYVSVILAGKKTPSVGVMDCLDRSGLVAWRDQVRRVIMDKAISVDGLSESQVAGLILYIRKLQVGAV